MILSDDEEIALIDLLDVLEMNAVQYGTSGMVSRRYLDMIPESLREKLAAGAS